MPVLTSGQQERKSKQRKIRNSEYYDMEGTFDRLYAESKKDKTFNHLMEIIESEENIKLAYRTIKRNTGSDTSGVDKMLSVKLDAPVPCRLDAPDLDLICYASADCLRQHLQVI